MKPRKVALALLEPEKFTESEQLTARVRASDYVNKLQHDLSLLSTYARTCEHAAQILRDPHGQPESSVAEARRFAAELIKEDLWRDAEWPAAALSGSGSYILQPPVFRSTAETRRMILSEGGCIYLDADSILHFGFPVTSIGEALIRALRIRQHTGEEIEVGAKANEQYDHLLSGLQNHIGHQCLPELFSGAVAFINIDAYATVYCRNPRVLLQPTHRQRQGLRAYPSPGRDEHERMASQIRELLRVWKPAQSWLFSRFEAVLSNSNERLRVLHG